MKIESSQSYKDTLAAILKAGQSDVAKDPEVEAGLVALAYQNALFEFAIQRKPVPPDLQAAHDAAMARLEELKGQRPWYDRALIRVMSWFERGAKR